MANKIVTLYISDASLRLMVTDGRRIQEWAESPLEPGLVKSNVVIEEEAVVAKIKHLFEAHKVKATKIMVGISGLRCLTRPITLPQLPKEMLDEAVKREAGRVLPVPLEQLYISWQTIPAPEGKIQVFLEALPRELADALLKALHKAGLKPSFMNLKPILLARVVKETTAIIVDVQITEFDIVIMVDGLPQPIRTVLFTNEASPWPEKLTMIKSELERTITFYNANNPEKALAASVPIFVSGDLATESELWQALSAEIGHPVLSASPPLDCPEGFAPSRYMTNIGLALQTLSSGQEATASVVNLNALPAPYQPKPISLTNILAPSGAAVAVALLAFLIMLTQSISADIAATRTRFNATTQLLQQKASQGQELTGGITELEKKITDVETSLNNLTAALGSLEKQGTEISRDLEVTIGSLPITMRLSSINQANGILTESGWAPNDKEALSYLKKLDTSGRFGELSITMSIIEGGGMNFTLLGSFQAQSKGVSSIKVVVDSLPPTVSLTSVSSATGILKINGKSLDEDAILSYLQDLRDSGQFSEIIININTITRTEDRGMEFSVVLKTGG